MQQKEFFGFGSIENLREILEMEKVKRGFLVTGKRSFESCGAREIFERYGFERFCDFSPNPKKEEIDRGFELFGRENYDIIIAVGGGSAIDVAKAIKMFYFNEINRKIPLVAIPTTGSGSEATYFIVYYDGKEKQSKGNLQITLPDYTICDPQLTMSLPKSITASTGMDALGQAMESYWSINSTDNSKELARQSIRLSMNNLEKAVNNPDKRSRENMMKAANLAGKAINLTQTTACHSIAYPFTSYFQIPHGHAVGLTLGEVLVYNSGVSEEDCLDKRNGKYVKTSMSDLNKILEVENSEQAREKIQTLMENIGLETRLSTLGLTEKDVELLIEKGFNPDRVKNNPRLLTENNLRKILENLI